MADITSTLPDYILCHVLSFLPPNQTVATSLLSKRWRRLWHSVIALDFCNATVRGERANFRFNQFVYSVLLSRDADHPIKSFRLRFQSDYPDCAYLGFANVVKWVDFVVQRRVEYLRLQLFTESWPKLPISILTCWTLVALKLRSLSVEVGVVFETEDRSEGKSFTLSKLIRAEIVCSCFDFPMKALQNVESLRIEIAKSDMDGMYCTGEEGDHIWVDPEFVLQCLSLHL